MNSIESHSSAISPRDDFLLISIQRPINLRCPLHLRDHHSSSIPVHTILNSSHNLSIELLRYVCLPNFYPRSLYSKRHYYQSLFTIHLHSLIYTEYTMKVGVNLHFDRLSLFKILLRSAVRITNVYKFYSHRVD